MRLVDSHAHLQAETFLGDGAEVLAAARVAGVERLLAPGWDIDSSRASIALAEHSGTGASVGIHPHVAASADAGAWSTVAELAGHPAVVAIGETGLDYDRGFSPRDAQLDNLRRHLALALELGKPLILHCRSAPGERDAQDELIRELAAVGVGGREWRARFQDRVRAVLHSFSGPVDYAERALEMGLAVSFSGLVFRRGEETSAEVARLVPGEHLLVETDSPYLSPPGAPKRRNEPLWVEVTARWLAVQRNEDPDAVGDSLVAAYDSIFDSGADSSAPNSSWPDGSDSR